MSLSESGNSARRGGELLAGGRPSKRVGKCHKERKRVSWSSKGAKLVCIINDSRSLLFGRCVSPTDKLVDSAHLESSLARAPTRSPGQQQIVKLPAPYNHQARRSGVEYCRIITHSSRQTRPAKTRREPQAASAPSSRAQVRDPFGFWSGSGRANDRCMQNCSPCVSSFPFARLL